MISQNALHHAEKCRFCWMCRHLCPVQHQTGKELNTPRAKGLLLSMVNKKAQEFDKDMGQAMYECLLCDACTNDCATGYQPPLFIREARTEAVVSEVAPESVMNLIENVETTGNIYGVEKPSYGQDGTDVLVYIGEVAAIKVPEMAKHLLALLAKAGVSAKVLANEPASGVMLGDLMGYTEEVRKQAEVCAKALNETGLPVVVLDSYDAEIMTQKYPEWGCEITAGVTTATAFVAKLLEEKKLAAKAALLILESTAQDLDELRIRQLVEPHDTHAREQRVVDLEEGILRCCADEDEPAILDVGQQHILLALVEAMNLVDEDNRAALVVTARLIRLLDDAPQVADAR